MGETCFPSVQVLWAHKGRALFELFINIGLKVTRGGVSIYRESRIFFKNNLLSSVVLTNVLGRHLG